MKGVFVRSLVAVAALLIAPLLAGWFHVLSKDTYFAVNQHADFAEVRAEPERFRGTTLLLAGQIVDRRDGDGSRLDILCFERDEADRPVDPDPECGRFRVNSPRILDPQGYAAGRLVTLAATVTGEREGGSPVFALLEIYPWPDPSEPRYRSYPYPPGWWCDPWWPDPFCDPFHPYSRWYGRFGWRW